MVFNSNTQMIKHYAKELLSDGNEHSLSEIREYIFQKNGEKCITGGELLNYNMMNCAVYNLAQPCSIEYMQTRRGHYQKICQEHNQKTIYEKVSLILEKAEYDVRQCVAANLHMTEMTEAELFETRDIIVEVAGFLVLARQKLEAAQDAQCEELSQDSPDETQDDRMQMNM